MFLKVLYKNKQEKSFNGNIQEFINENLKIPDNMFEDGQQEEEGVEGEWQHQQQWQLQQQQHLQRVGQQWRQQQQQEVKIEITDCSTGRVVE